MADFSKYQSVGTDGNTDYYIADPEFLMAILKAGMDDTAQTARTAVDFQTAIDRKSGIFQPDR